MSKLIECHICQKPISSGAATCPHCGEPRNTKPAVTVSDIDMQFTTMVSFMVKAAIAAIPAAIILVIIVAMVGGVFGGMFGRH